MASTHKTRGTCPFCGHHGDFLPFGVKSSIFMDKKIVGGGRRSGVQCANCRSLDRERLLYLYLVNSGALNKPLDVLHVAPEKQLSARLAESFGDRYVKVGLRNQGDECWSLMCLPFADVSFDLVICNHVLEHVSDDKIAMREILRVLRDGGLAILQVPLALGLERTYEDSVLNTEKERLEAYGQEDHLRLYGRDYPEVLARAGFKVDTFSWAGLEAFGGRWNRHSLNLEEPLYLAWK